MILKHKLDGVVGNRLRRLHDAPQQLFYKGADPSHLLQAPAVALVGSRKMTPYGRAVTELLAAELARAGVVIISGLALGVDSAAHRACLEAGGITIAVLPSSPDVIYPASHRELADQIVLQGGALLSEYGERTSPKQYTFIARNRIIAALADAVIVTEAAEKSGALHTADFALDLGIPVMAVPGNITSTMSGGTNRLIQTGALPVTSALDILDALGITPDTQLELVVGTSDEQKILQSIQTGVSNGTALLSSTGLSTASFTQALTMLEINGRVKNVGADTWALA